MVPLAESWAAPVDPREAVICAELDQLEPVEVQRASEAEMAYMKMLARECHQNCLSYARLDPEDLSKHVIGWIPWPEAYVLHSVIERQRELFCVTPMLTSSRSSLFIADDRLSLIADPNGPGYRLARDGVLLDLPAPGARRKPDECITFMTDIKNRLLNGENPQKVMELMGFGA